MRQNILKFNHFLSVIFILFCSQHLFSQSTNTLAFKDTVTMNMDEVEQRFISKNLNIIAAKYNIDIADAGVLQAKQWYNPNLSIDGDFIDQSNSKIFNWGNGGNSEAQFQQLFSIAGKHTNTVKLAKQNLLEAKLIFLDFLRALKFQLYTDYGNILYSQQQLTLLENQEKSLMKLLEGMKQMKKVGAVSGNDVLRLEAELTDLRNQFLAIESNMLDAQTDIKTLLQIPENVYLVLKEPVIKQKELPQIQNVLDSVSKTRPDVLLTHQDIELQKTNLNLQKSIAVPDMSFILGWTHQGSWRTDYNYIGLSSDLPVFNRNQGNIKAAKFQVKQSEANDSIQMLKLKNEIVTSYVTVARNQQRINELDTKYSEQLDELMQNAVSNYQKRNINLLDFLDQLRTYTAAKTSLINLMGGYFGAIQDFNFKTGNNYFR